MKVLIVGYGSIGKRHFSLLKKRNIETAVVTKRTDVDANVFPSLDLALKDFQPHIVFICNETYKHWPTLNSCLRSASIKKIIVEKPLTDFLNKDILSLSSVDQERICVSYNFRFSPLLQLLKQEVKGQKVYDAVVNVGQDLNQWRDRKGIQTYSADRNRGGGALRDLSHELDYIQWIFDPVLSFVSCVEKKSALTNDSEDLVFALLKTNLCSTLFMRLSYLDKDPIRVVRVNAQNHTYVIDLIQGTFAKDGKILLENHKIAETYEYQMDACLKFDFQNFCSLPEAISDMKLIEQIEEKANTTF